MGRLGGRGRKARASIVALLVTGVLVAPLAALVGSGAAGASSTTGLGQLDPSFGDQVPGAATGVKSGIATESLPCPATTQALAYGSDSSDPADAIVVAGSAHAFSGTSCGSAAEGEVAAFTASGAGSWVSKPVFGSDTSSLTAVGVMV